MSEFKLSKPPDFFGVTGLQLRVTAILVVVLACGLVYPQLRVSEHANSDSEAWSQNSSILNRKVAEIENRWKARKNALEAKEKANVTFRINLNAATNEELIKLPGIGPELARRIMEYRIEKDGFSSIDELRKVKGIGIKKLKRIRPYLDLN